MRRAGAAAAVGILLALGAGEGRAQGEGEGRTAAPADDPAAQEEAFRAARAAEGEGRWGEAARQYARALDASRRGGRTVAARQRLAWIEARRDAGGGFGGLEELQAARGAGSGAPGARERVERLFARGDLSSALRAEAGIWLAQDALERRGDPGAALAITRALWPGAAELPPEVRGILARRHAEALAGTGRWEEARAVEAGALEPAVAAAAARSRAERLGPVDLMAREEARRRLALASWGALLAFGAVGGPLAWRGWRRRPRPLPWGFLPLLALVGLAGVLVELYEPSSGRAFPALAAAAAGIHGVAAGAGIEARARPPGATRRALRLGLGLLAAAATLGAAYLVFAAHGELLRVGL